MALWTDSLCVSFPAAGGRSVSALRAVSLRPVEGRCLVIVGESGSGKSTLIRCLAGLRPNGAQVTGDARLDGLDLVRAPESALRAVRGLRIGFVGQDPFAAFDPLFPVEDQIVEACRAHARVSQAEALARTRASLAAVGLALSDRRPPHRCSGGMLQRASLAAARIHRPEVLLLDEPTSALDTATQGRVLDLIRAQDSPICVLTTHDLAVARRVADDLVVMQDGQVVEAGPADRVLDHPSHPFTRGLLAAHPSRMAREAST